MKRLVGLLLGAILVGCGGNGISFDQVGHGTLDTGDLYANSRYYDVWTFVADSSGDASFKMRSGDLDSYLALEDDNGYVLSENDDGGGGLSAQITEYLQSGRTYYLIATSSRPDELGDYDVLWQNWVTLESGPNHASIARPISPKPKR